MHNISTRLKAIIHYENFQTSCRKVAALYGVSKSTVSRWVKVGMNDCCVRQRPTQRKRQCRILNSVQNAVDSELTSNPFCSVTDIQHALSCKHALYPSLSTIARCRHKLGYRFKMATRCQAHQPTDQSHPFFKERDAYDNVIAVDESSFVSSDIPRRGWAKGGAAVPKPAPKGRTRMSLILAFDKQGNTFSSTRTGSFN